MADLGIPTVIALSKADLVDPDSAGRARFAFQDPGNTEMENRRRIVSLSAVGVAPGLEAFETALAGLVSEVPTVACGAQPAEAAVVDASTSRQGGPSLLCVVRRGALRVGDTFVCGNLHGHVKALWKCDATDRILVDQATAGERSSYTGREGDRVTQGGREGGRGREGETTPLRVNSAL